MGGMLKRISLQSLLLIGFFPVIWTTLFILMAIALGRVWSKGWKKNSLGIVLFFIQLGLNVLWCALFFGFNLFLFGFIEIVFLWFAILATIIEFWQTEGKVLI
jgi:tryptophan-rich sensory protein